MILIKGGEGALKFLASLITAVADEVENDGFSISPTGAGANYFSKMSTMGIYIYRKPKDRGPGRIKSGEKSKKSVRVTRNP